MRSMHRCSACRDLAELSKAAERRRILAELHDVLGQELTLLALECDLALAAAAGSPCAPGLGRIRRRAHRLIQSAAMLAQDTRPVSLGESIERARHDLALAGVELRLDPGLPGLAGLRGARDGRGFQDIPGLRQQADAFLACVVREGVTNVLRHAPTATKCEISTRNAGELIMVIRNDGAAGAASACPGAGIGGLRERAAALAARIEATAYGGIFALTAYVPAAAAVPAPEAGQREWQGSTWTGSGFCWPTTT